MEIIRAVYTFMHSFIRVYILQLMHVNANRSLKKHMQAMPACVL